MLPRIRIDDVGLREGNTGVTLFTFVVTLSNPSTQVVTVQYATADRKTPHGGDDYEPDVVPTSGTLVFAPGQTSATITVHVWGDDWQESDETFFVNRTSPVNARLLDAQGVGTILEGDEGS